MIIDEQHWKLFANRIAAPNNPEDYSPASIKRLMGILGDRVKHVKGIQFQFKPRNSCLSVEFQSDWARDFYNEAEKRMNERKEMLEGKSADEGNTAFARLAILNEYRQAAEYAKAEVFAKRIVEKLQKGLAPLVAVDYQATIAKIVKELKEKYGIERDRLSLIWGGSSSFSEENQISTQDIRNFVDSIIAGKIFSDKETKEMLKALKHKSMGLEDLGEDLRLGSQSRPERQKETIAFQKQETDGCLFTKKSGGVALSLHHSDDYTIEKVRRKASGWCYPEDIFKIPTRQRSTDVSPTYSFIEFVQALGRTARITSLSDTEQFILFYKGTIEEIVQEIVSSKLKCLKAVVNQREHWEDAIYNPGKYKKQVEEFIADENENTEALLEYEEEEEEEN